jgi:hypothetical protein
VSDDESVEVRFRLEVDDDGWPPATSGVPRISAPGLRQAQPGTVPLMNVEAPTRVKRLVFRSVSIPLWFLPVIALIGVLLGGVLFYYLVGSKWGVPHSVTGKVIFVNDKADGIVFQPDDWPHRDDGGADGGWSYTLGPVEWVDRDGQVKTDGTPACLAPLSHGQRVELWLLDVRGDGPGPGEVITRVRCAG